MPTAAWTEPTETRILTLGLRIYGQQAGHCAGCATHFEIQHLDVDHIIARSKGGTDHPENLQLLCDHCNSVKGDRGMEYLRTELQLAA